MAGHDGGAVRRFRANGGPLLGNVALLHLHRLLVAALGLARCSAPCSVLNGLALLLAGALVRLIPVDYEAGRIKVDPSAFEGAELDKPDDLAPQLPHSPLPQTPQSQSKSQPAIELQHIVTHQVAAEPERTQP